MREILSRAGWHIWPKPASKYERSRLANLAHCVQAGVDETTMDDGDTHGSNFPPLLWQLCGWEVPGRPAGEILLEEQALGVTVPEQRKAMPATCPAAAAAAAACPWDETLAERASCCCCCCARSAGVGGQWPHNQLLRLGAKAPV